MIVIPTGYMSSGSSAVTDLLSEIKGFSNIAGSQEFIFMHCPHGIFDLYKSLINPISHSSSDEAIREFYDMMNKLYELNGWWPSGYKHDVSNSFMKYVDEFIDEITDYKFKGFWYMHEMPRKRTFAQKVKNRLTKTNYLDYLNDIYMSLSYPSKEKFYASSKRFINKIINNLNKTNEKNIIIDQLLLPYNLANFENYFDDAKVIVVERDPRDVFILNKTIEAKVPYPMDPDTFVKFYKELRNLSKNNDNCNVLRIKFEDLIYKYDETLKIIYNFLNIKKEAHIHKKEKFIPEKSIDNTQLFINYQNKEEIKIIEKELKEYLYDFPYVYDKKERNIF